MADSVIDLRSDTVTKPSPEMRRAMAEAEVGDDVFIEDPTVNRLQDRAAEIFKREASLFVPSGTMGNLTCILAQTRPGQEVICEEAGHIYNYEMASMSAIAGVLARKYPQYGSRHGLSDESRASDLRQRARRRYCSSSRWSPNLQCSNLSWRK